MTSIPNEPPPHTDDDRGPPTPDWVHEPELPPDPGPDPDLSREGPRDHEAERRVLGAILLGGAETLASVRPLLPLAALTMPGHRVLYGALIAVAQANDPVDASTVGALLSARGQLAEVGGYPGIAALLAEVPTQASAEASARVVVDQYRRRQLAEVGEVIRRAASEGGEIGAAIEGARRAVERIQDEEHERAREGIVVQIRADIGVKPPAERPPLLVLEAEDTRAPDDLTALHRGSLGLLSAAGGVGKSWLGYQLATAIAIGDGLPWCGMQVAHVARGGRVLMLLGEADRTELEERLHRVVRRHGRDGTGQVDDGRVREAGRLVSERVTLLPLAGRYAPLMTRDKETGDWQPGELAELVEAELRRHDDWSLVFVDPMSCFASADVELDPSAATRFVHGALARLREAAGGAAVLCTAHVSKAARNAWTADVNDTRGSGALTDAARWVASLKRMARPKGLADGVPDVVGMSITKSNLTRRLPELHPLEVGPGGPLVRARATTLAAYEDAERAAREAIEDEREAQKEDRKTRAQAKRATNGSACDHILGEDEP